MVWAPEVDAETTIVTVDSDGDVGLGSSLVLDVAGDPVIAYFDDGNLDLKVAHCNDVNCSGGGDSIVAVDVAGDVGGYISLVLDAVGNPVISYSDLSNDDLTVVHCNDANCAGGGESVRAVDGAADVGTYTSLVLDAAGNPVIAYYDGSNGDLKVAHCNDANCEGGGERIVTVDRADVGTDTSLALDAAGNPVISYYDFFNEDLKVAHCNDANCEGADESIVTVDSPGIVGSFTSLELDAMGNPVVSYYDGSNGDLKLAHCNDADCEAGGDSIVTVDDADGTVGFDTSLALDAVGNPVISYADLTNGDLKVAHCDDANCAGGGERIVAVDSVGDVGTYTSLVLDAAGNPVISYRDIDAAALKLAHCDNANCTPPPPLCDGVEATIAGTAGDDVLDGTPGSDVIFAGDGDDLINGLEGDDAICGGDGRDRIEGGAGDDRLDGGEGVDTVDYSFGAAGVSVSLATGSATGDGSDELADVETVIGSPFDDVLIGSGGDDFLLGGEGNDVVAGSLGNDMLDGQAGVDTANFAASAEEVDVNLSTGTAAGEGADQLVDIEGLIGSPFDDVLTGDDGRNGVEGGDGDDVLAGSAGDDALVGGAGADTADFTASPTAVSANLTTGNAAGEGTDALAGARDRGRVAVRRRAHGGRGEQHAPRWRRPRSHRWRRRRRPRVRRRWPRPAPRRSG